MGREWFVSVNDNYGDKLVRKDGVREKMSRISPRKKKNGKRWRWIEGGEREGVVWIVGVGR